MRRTDGWLTLVLAMWTFINLLLLAHYLPGTSSSVSVSYAPNFEARTVSATADEGAKPPSAAQLAMGRSAAQMNLRATMLENHGTPTLGSVLVWDSEIPNLGLISERGLVLAPAFRSAFQIDADEFAILSDNAMNFLAAVRAKESENLTVEEGADGTLLIDVPMDNQFDVRDAARAIRSGVEVANEAIFDSILAKEAWLIRTQKGKKLTIRRKEDGSIIIDSDDIHIQIEESQLNGRIEDENQPIDNALRKIEHFLNSPRLKGHISHEGKHSR